MLVSKAKLKTSTADITREQLEIWIRTPRRTEAHQIFLDCLLYRLAVAGFSQQIHVDSLFYHSKYGVKFFDIYIPSIDLIIEIDGRRHNGTFTMGKDLIKDSMARALGLNIIRITNESALLEVNASKTIDSIVACWKNRPLEKPNKKSKRIISYGRKRLLEIIGDENFFKKGPTNRLEYVFKIKNEILVRRHFGGHAYIFRGLDFNINLKKESAAAS